MATQDLTHSVIARTARGTAVWYSPDCAACAANHHPATLPTTADVADYASRAPIERVDALERRRPLQRP